MPDRLTTVALCALVLAAASCKPSAPPHPNVLVVVIDTLRADRLGAYGNPRGLTPFLDTLARRGTVFERAYAASSWTVPSVASLFTSRYPSQHRTVTFSSRLVPEEVTIAERLHDAGWVAGGYSANPILRREWGFGQGFAEFWSDKKAPQVAGDILREHGLTWLDQNWNRSSPAPAMLFFQYMEPHAPYEPAEPFRSRFALDDAGRALDLKRAGSQAFARVLRNSGGDPSNGRDPRAALHAIVTRGRPPTKDEMAPLERLYDADVATADDQIRQLFAALEGRGFLENALVVVTSDHSEEFYEHGSGSHGKTLYEESVRVPLIVVGPGVRAGGRVKDRVSLVDVAPTLLKLLDLPPEPLFEGRSLLPLLRRTAGEGLDIIMQLEPKLATMDNRVHVRGLIRGEQKLLVRADGGVELYDLASDPGETSDALARIEARLGARAAPTEPPAPLDDATKRQLRALGYTF